MTHRPLLTALLSLALLGAACSGDDDDVVADAATDDQAVQNDDAASGASDDVGDEVEDTDDGEGEGEVTETTTVDQFDFAGGPPPSTQLIMGGPNGKATVTFDCVGEGTGIVHFEIEGVPARSVVPVQVGARLGDVVTDAYGSGRADVEGELPQPTPVAVLFESSTQRGRLQGC